MKRKTQWIEGFEFFEFELNYDNDLIQKIESFFEINLSVEIKQYLKHFKPIEIWDKSKYDDTVEFVYSEYVLEPEAVINPNLNMFLPFYNLNEIIHRLMAWDSVATSLFRKLKLLPICQGVPNGDIVVSLNDDDTNGKLYYIIDHYNYEIDNDTLFCNSLFKFISGLKEVPKNRTKY